MGPAAKRNAVLACVLLSALVRTAMMSLGEDFLSFTTSLDYWYNGTADGLLARENGGIAYEQWLASEQNRSQVEFDESMQIIPTWMADYLIWHREQRLEPTNETKYLVVRCLEGEVCGGLSDRMKPFPFFVMVANLTRRVLLVHWKKPCELENFLSPPPNGLNWSVAGTPVTIDEIRNKHNFVNGHAESLSTEVRMLMGILDAKGRGHLQTCRVLNVLLDGGKYIRDANVLFNKWRAEPGQRGSSGGAYLGWKKERTDVNDHDLWVDVFRIMFEPSPNIRTAIYKKMFQLNLLDTEFNVAQVRAKDPRKIPDDVAIEWFQQYNPGQVIEGNTLSNMKWKIDTEASFEFGPKMTEFFARIFSNAIICADNLAPGSNLPIYLASDSSFGGQMNNISSYPIRVATKGPNSTPLHIDGNNFQGLDPTAFHQVFVDTFVMARARCVSTNSGFGYLAVRVSGNTCSVNHAGTVCVDSRNSTDNRRNDTGSMT